MIVSDTAFIPAFKKAMGLLGLQREHVDRISAVEGSNRSAVRRWASRAETIYVSPLCDRSLRSLFPKQARLLNFANHLDAESIEELEAWLLWFAAMGTPDRYPWSVHLVWKLLHNDPQALSLLANDPFPGAPPKQIRALLYRYEFAPLGDPSGAWWRRTLLGTWMPPLSIDDPRLRRFLDAYGWLPGGPPRPGV